MRTTDGLFFINHDKAFDYLLAGNALFTVINTQSQRWFTFKIIKKQVNFNRPLWNVYFLYKNPNENNFLELGAILENKFLITKTARVKESSTVFCGFEYIFRRLKDKTLPTFFELYRYKRCGHCGKILTNPDSIIDGIGARCKQVLEKTKFVHPELYK